MTGAKHTSPAVAELVDGDASHEQYKSFPLPHCEVALQYEPHQQCYHQDLQAHRIFNGCPMGSPKGKGGQAKGLRKAKESVINRQRKGQGNDKRKGKGKGNRQGKGTSNGSEV